MSWLGFRFISSSAHETIPPFPLTRSHGAHPLPRLPLQMRLFSFLGLNGPYPGSLGAGCSRGPATSSRNPPSPGGRDGSSSFPRLPFRPHSLPMLTLTGRTASRLHSTVLLGPVALPAASKQAGRRPGQPAAPRPQGNRREPMTDRGPEERDPPSSSLSDGQTSSVGRT